MATAPDRKPKQPNGSKRSKPPVREASGRGAWLLAAAAAVLAALVIGAWKTGSSSPAGKESLMKPARDPAKDGLVLAAVHAGDVGRLASLLSSGASADAVQPSGFRALHLCAQGGNAAVAQALLEHGADADTAHGGWVPLHLSAGAGHAGVVRLLMAHGANTETVTAMGATALHLAAQFGHADTVRILLQAGAFADAPQPDGATALHLATENKHTAVVRELVQGGASVDLAAYKGWRTLHMACESGEVAIARLLLEAGAQPSAPRADGRTPLHFAAQRLPQNAALVAALLEHGAHVDARSVAGETALHVAVRLMSADVAKLLLGAGASADVRTVFYQLTPLHIAAEIGATEIAAALLAHGAALEATDWLNHSAVYAASYFGHAQTLQTLLVHAAELRRRGTLPAEAEAALELAPASAAALAPSSTQRSAMPPTLKQISVAVPPREGEQGTSAPAASAQEEAEAAAAASRAMAHAASLWWQHGVVSFPSALPARVVQQVRRAVVSEREARVEDHETTDASLSIRSPKHRTLRALDVANVSALVLRAMAARLAPFLRAILGPTQLLLESSFLETTVGALDQDMHTDVLMHDTRLASVQVALVDTSPTQGALQVVPGTHRTGVRDLLRPDGTRRARAEADAARRVVVAVPKGTVTFYSPSLLHRGSANTDTKDRIFLGLTFLGVDGVVPSGIPYVLHAHDVGRWWLMDGALHEKA